MFLKTNRPRWDSNPRTQTVWDEQSNALTTGPPCLSSVLRLLLNWTNKFFKERCSASNRIIFFCSKQKNLSNQTIVRSKIDLYLRSVYLKCTDEFSTLQPVTAFKLSKEAKQKFKENLVLNCPHWKTMFFVKKKSAKKNWSFSKFYCLNGFNRKSILLANRTSSWINLCFWSTNFPGELLTN